MIRKLRYDELALQRLSQEQALNIERHPISLLLHNIRSLYNVGSLFRTADAALVEKIYLCGYTPTPPRKEIEKTALGAVHTVPWEYGNDTCSVIRLLQQEHIKVWALELTTQSRSVYDFESDDFPMCLVVGNEITGVDDAVLRACNGAVAIPMYGVKHSLNVAVAAGIAVFEAVRRWHSVRNLIRSDVKSI
ncbi:MAG: RNA methyltransferase [Bacteroidota bacterium]|nr:RNA methyltransferase [Candidatus Kapabacteria bacterium]MDW8218907.1 RNA methyltransferase [Bacteroidota bacterium]